VVVAAAVVATGVVVVGVVMAAAVVATGVVVVGVVMAAAVVAAVVVAGGVVAVVAAVVVAGGVVVVVVAAVVVAGGVVAVVAAVVVAGGVVAVVAAVVVAGGVVAVVAAVVVAGGVVVVVEFAVDMSSSAPSCGTGPGWGCPQAARTTQHEARTVTRSHRRPAIIDAACVPTANRRPQPQGHETEQARPRAAAQAPGALRPLRLRAFSQGRVSPRSTSLTFEL